MIRHSFLLVLFAVLLSTAAVPAQTAVAPCGSENHRQLDFWLGSWDLEWTNPQGRTLKGENEITKILDGCVIREQFNGGDVLPLRGQSYSMFDRLSGKWKQTWVDNQGGYLDFTGGLEDGKMVFSRSFKNPAGKKIMQRMVFFNIGKDALEWNWENSTDEGKTWNLAWHIKYVRRK